MSHGPLLLEGALVLAQDEAGTVGWLSVAVAEERIAALGQPDELRARFPSAERIDCRGRILLPGLVNAHLHPELHVLKGAVEELHLHEWDGAHLLDGGVALLSDPDGGWIQRAAVRAALAEAILAGTTALGCYGVTVGADEVTEEALVDLGLRGVVTVRDEAFEPVPAGGVPRVFRLHAEEALEEAELEACARAHARGERIVMHAAETEHRLDLVRARFGTTTVRLLHRYGLLSPRLLLSHAVHVDDEEAALLAAHGVMVVSSPTAELKLADGIAPISDYLERGMTVALGTDCATCNNGTDLFLEMRHLGLTQKLRYGAHAVPAERILLMATRDGARALAGGGEFGALEPGLSADLVLVDTRNPRLRPLVHRPRYSNIAANLVYAATGQDVTDVMARGRWLVRGRRLLVADEATLWRDLQRAADALHDRIL
jgi:5-methylthioadenosine/S-adenosylhomocysteine deaminase